MEIELSVSKQKAIIKYANYCYEVTALERKLRNNGTSASKQAKRLFRLNDIRRRLLPKCIRLLN